MKTNSTRAQFLFGGCVVFFLSLGYESVQAGKIRTLSPEAKTIHMNVAKELRSARSSEHGLKFKSVARRNYKIKLKNFRRDPAYVAKRKAWVTKRLNASSETKELIGFLKYIQEQEMPHVEKLSFPMILNNNQAATITIDENGVVLGDELFDSYYKDQKTARIIHAIVERGLKSHIKRLAESKRVSFYIDDNAAVYRALK